MIIKTRKGDVELRSQEWGSSWMIPPPGSDFVSDAGIIISSDAVFGLPAVGNVIRSAAEVVASLPFRVYKGDPPAPAPNTWQWSLLMEQPDHVGTSSYSFFYDIALSLEGTQNCFIYKQKSQRRIEALSLIDPQKVKVHRDDSGDKLFDIYISPNETKKNLTTEEVLHIRGYTPRPGSDSGLSLLQAHRQPLGNALALQGFEGDYFKNNAMPPFWFTGAKNQAHAQELISFHNAQHQGQGKRWKTGALWGEVDVKNLPISMNDAQWADARRTSIEDACRIWRWPKELVEISMGRDTYPTDENAWMTRILKLYVLPRLKRIERAFAADTDLFFMSGLTGCFDTEEFQRADWVARNDGYKNARQAGWLTANEIRAKENLPPLPGGDELLMTPTGSAPNPQNEASGAPSQNGYKESEVVG